MRFLRAAKQGDVKAQVLLALLYETEKEVFDLKAALSWYLAAAAQGDAYAQFSAGFMYDFRPPPPHLRDPQQAIKWYAKAAAQGDRSAQGALDLMHKKGDDVPFKLLGWYRDAEIGDSEKQWMLAGRYRTGDGVVKSAADALSWLQQSAERGYFLAQWELGAGYVEGDFVPKILRWLICG